MMGRGVTEKEMWTKEETEWRKGDKVSREGVMGSNLERIER